MLVDAAGGGEDGVGPEDDAFVAGGAGEGSALFDEGAAEAEAASSGVDEEQAKACGGGGVGFGVADEKDAAETLVVALGDPAALAGGSR